MPTRGSRPCRLISRLGAIAPIGSRVDSRLPPRPTTRQRLPPPRLSPILPPAHIRACWYADAGLARQLDLAARRPDKPVKDFLHSKPGPHKAPIGNLQNEHRLRLSRGVQLLAGDVKRSLRSGVGAYISRDSLDAGRPCGSRPSWSGPRREQLGYCPYRVLTTFAEDAAHAYPECTLYLGPNKTKMKQTKNAAKTPNLGALRDRHVDR